MNNDQQPQQVSIEQLQTEVKLGERAKMILSLSQEVQRLKQELQSVTTMNSEANTHQSG